MNFLDRRVFCTGTAASFLAPNLARGERTVSESRHLSDKIAQSSAGFDLKSAPNASFDHKPR
jgi:hypothetical protein